MPKLTIPYTDFFLETMRRLGEDGLLLVTSDVSGKPNVMTIGWATIGLIWARPVMIVLVRPSRHTCSRLAESPDFTVNVAPPEMAEAVARCGVVSGRDHDKFAECGLTLTPGREVQVPIIEQCAIHYECRTVHRNDLVPEAIAPALVERFYPRGDFHRVFFGEILTAYADENAAERLLPRE